ncbi:Hypp6409 [Branchiostoma lanceolatum]|uniref:Hypp6409 protein n=1 Tax=Branchiostoma lanceolatum TaxID=7740 RepID=A0A8J9YU52_BRALA|nr:Hypp6409 [Branchiostoma lanceolatum]
MAAYDPRAVRGLGWTLVALGSLSVLLGVAADINFGARNAETMAHYVSAPVWSGLLVLTTGILGIFSAKKPTNKCLIVAFMVVGIFVILACGCCIFIAALGIVLNPYIHDCQQYDWTAYYAAQARHEQNATVYEEPYVWHFQTYDCRPAAIGLHAVNIVLALVELVLGFVVSILSCCGLCTMRREAEQVGTADKISLISNTVVYAAGPVPDGAQGNVVIMQGTPGVQGNQPQIFVAQNPGVAGEPAQMYYPAQAPPVYQVDPGVVPGAHEEKKGPTPAESVWKKMATILSR